MKTKQKNMKKMKNIVSKLSVKKLCESFEITNEKHGPEIAIVRDVLMSELEKRNQESYDSWIDTEDVSKRDFPSLFFK